MSANSTWTALRNPVFRNMWLASLISGTCVAAQDTAATWTMNRVSDSPLFLSLMSTVASLPFFFFTLPAGALADMVDRKRMMFVMTIWLGIAAGGLAFFGFLNLINPWVLLTAVFLIGTGFAFYSPAWTSIQPEIVTNEELPSASTLGGLQLNISGIIGPALGGLLLRVVNPNVVFAMNAVCFFLLLIAIQRLKHPKPPSNLPLESFLESFVTAIRYVLYTPGIQIVLARNLLFAFFISIIPSLIPVVGLKELHLDPSNLGLVFTCMGIGSVLGAVFILPWARARFHSNTVTVLANILVAVVFFLMGTVRQPALFLVAAGIGGSGMDHGGFRALGCRTARHAELGARPDECDDHHGCPRRDGSWGNCLGYFRFHLGGATDPDRRLSFAVGDLDHSTSLIDRFYKFARFRAGAGGRVFAQADSYSCAPRRPGCDHD